MPIPLDSGGNGQGEDSWLTSCRWTPSEHDDGIDISDDRGSYMAHYVPLRPMHNAEDNSLNTNDPKFGALHVVVAGKSEDQFGDAWGAYRFIGHIRPSDGMITLLRDNNDPLNSGLGRSIFRGYVTSSQNFVGRWRHTYVDADVPDWEAPFSLCKENVHPILSHPKSSEAQAPLRRYVSYVSRTCSRWGDRLASRVRRALSRYHTSSNFVQSNFVRRRRAS